MLLILDLLLCLIDIILLLLLLPLISMLEMLLMLDTLKCPVDIKLSVRRRFLLWLDLLDIMVNPVPKRSISVS